MLRGMLGRVWSPFDEAEKDGESDHRFVPSVLDRSVLFAHGGGNGDVDRELSEVQETARELEEHRPK